MEGVLGFVAELFISDTPGIYRKPFQMLSFANGVYVFSMKICMNLGRCVRLPKTSADAMTRNPADSLPQRSTCIVFDIRRYLPGGWYLPGAFIVQQDSDGKLTYILQNATPDTIGSYGYLLTPSLSQLFTIIGNLTEKALEDKYNVPKSKPKPLETLLQDQEMKRHIESYVHRQMDVFLQKMLEGRLPLTFMAEKKVLMEDVLVRYSDESLTPHLIFRRMKDRVIYRLNFSVGDERWLVRWKTVIPLTNQPGWLLVNGTLFPLPDLNGYMIKPFMNKDEVPVPNHIVRDYFRKFIMKAVEKTEIEAEGFEITSTRKLEGCELALTKHLFREQWSVAIRFQYLGATFQQNDTRQMRTALHFSTLDNTGKPGTIEGEADIRVMRVKRDPEAEQRYLEALANMGFTMTEGSLWSLPGRVGEWGNSPFRSAAEWLAANSPQLQAAGFSLELPVADGKKISLLPSSWTHEVLQRKDWFDLLITIRVGNFEFPFSKMVNHIREENPFFPLPDGTFFIIPAEWMTRFHGLAHLGKTEGDGLRLSKSQRPLLESAGIADTGDLQPEEKPDFQLPGLLRATLRPYQHEGAQWLARHYHENLGACLADDMGLGKTLQTLAVLLFAKENSSQRETATTNGLLTNSTQPELFDEPGFAPLQALILLPASLVFNWEQEIRKFALGISVCRHVGPQRTKDARILGRYDIVLTTYQTAQRDLDLLKKINWEFAVLDESQYIKNPESQIFKAVGALPARHKISLSGTPIENSLSDLWAQMQFLNPGMLGSYTYFKRHYIRPIEKQDDEAKKEELRQLVQPYLLRRTKEMVATDLPPLSETVFYSEMTDGQRKLYEQEKSAARNQLLNIGAPNLPHNRVTILAALTRLRQLALHPILTTATEPPEIRNPKSETDKSEIRSGKFDDVLEFWSTIRRSGHKVLIFSFFEKYLQLFRAEFEKDGQPYAWLTGDVSQKMRQQQVEKFNDDPSVRAFLMTTTAGGVGLNLTAADYVFVLDPWWNPFRESQAIARAHRIGQTKNVMAVKFIARETIEEKILQLQQRKSDLAGEFLDLGEKMVQTQEDLAFLLS